jgi:predicted lipid-binding transport protein (Tim44 family)
MVYALIAAALVFWLRSILGTRSEDDPFVPVAKMELNEEGKIVTIGFPGNEISDQLSAIEGLLEEEKGNMSIETVAARDSLIEIAKNDAEFNVETFLQATQDVFVYVVESFADGDRETLADLLSPQVYEAFDSAIAAREAAEETMQAEIQSIKKSSVVAARLDGSRAFVTVRFLAEEITHTKDKDGNMIQGHPDKVIQMRDVWTFSRDLKSNDPRWIVVETREDEVEDNETIPNTH